MGRGVKDMARHFVVKDRRKCTKFTLNNLHEFYTRRWLK